MKIIEYTNKQTRTKKKTKNVEIMILNYLENEPQQARLNTNSVASACKARENM